ncbi:MAG: hypothetical protein ABJA66_17980 [Actinomycetota bacterium]
MSEEREEIIYKKPKWWIDAVAAVFLLAATAAVVVWQNSRLTVLYDLCGVLENAYRISLGDVPYRDFPFPYAPLTFVIQAAIIKLTGAVYWHHILYCALIGGLGTVLAWRIMRHLLVEKIPAANLISFIFAVPLVILGIYCIFPHPFYDPDAVFIILLSILLLLRLEKKDFPPCRTFFAGMLPVITLFVKQNIGIFFLGPLCLSLLILIIVNLRRKESIRGYLLLLAGIITGLTIAVLFIHFTAGLDNYWYWTIVYARLRRAPSWLDMLSVYQDWSLIIWILLFAVGALLLWKNEPFRGWKIAIGVCLMSAPFVWTVIYLFLDADVSERAERLVGVFPFIMIAAFIVGIFGLKQLQGIASFLPFILIATLHGVFLSQQLWGSTYAVWALLLIMVAALLPALFRLSKAESGGWFAGFAGIVSISLIVSGGFYVYANERLDYVSFDDGEMAHSKLPPLAGLSMRGSYIPDFEELVEYTDREIPRDDGILILPGEDLFNYTTGRKPKFSVLLFDVTNNPLSPDEILEQVKTRDIRWLIVKNDLEIEVDKTIDNKEQILEILKPEFKNIESLNNYEIYRRRMPGETDDEDNSDDSDDSDDSGNTDDN